MKRSEALSVTTPNPARCTNFEVAQLLLGLILMADFAQGLDASKLILAETVRFQSSCGICSSTPAHARSHIQLLSFIISPYAAPAYNFPLFLFGLYVQESQEAAPRLLQVASSIFSQPTSIYI